jgi:hypothetical protein
MSNVKPSRLLKQIQSAQKEYEKMQKAHVIANGVVLPEKKLKGSPKPRPLYSAFSPEEVSAKQRNDFLKELKQVTKNLGELREFQRWGNCQ